MNTSIKFIKWTVLSSAVIGVLVSFQNCGKISVADISESAKAKTLADNSVFSAPPTTDNSNIPVSSGGTGSSDTGSDVPVHNGGGSSDSSDTGNDVPVSSGGQQAGTGGDTDSNIPVNSGGNSSSDTGSNIPVNTGSGSPSGSDEDVPVVNGNSDAELPVVRVCADQLLTNTYVYSQKIARDNKALIASKPFVKQTQTANVIVRRMDNNSVVCDESINEKDLIIKSSKIILSKACVAKLVIGVKYDVIIHDPNEPVITLGSLGQADMLMSTVKPSWWLREDYLIKQGNSSLKLYGEGGIRVLYDRATVNGRQNSDPNCDSSVADPLIVALDEKVDYVRLTSQQEGISFDILGQNSAPVAHAPKQISWFQNVNHSYYFVVLPNEQGEVLGIDQMFGDNTLGPDGKFAKDGYAALAKYDSDKDRKITANDEIFSKLRLWHDANLDGKASKDELFSLDDKGIVAIDLRFKRSYYERDQYGNETRRKSVVKTKDGKYHLIFDLWFNYVK